jgi:DNA transformation protein
MPPPPDRPIADLKNLGPTSSDWLRAVGIETYGDLEAAGAVEAYQRVVAAGFRASRNLLYAMQASLLGLHWSELPDEEKARLNAEIRG